MTDRVDRRRFLRTGMMETLKAAAHDARLQEKRWIRPPFALPEAAFLAACNRCGACARSCTYGVVRLVSARFGADIGQTPALDLVNRACLLCADWPCVQACDTGALALPESGRETGEEGGIPLPVLAEAAIDPRHCLPYSGPECGACEAACPVMGALVFEQARPRIERGKCVGCAQCRKACITHPKAVLIRAPGPPPPSPGDSEHVQQLGRNCQGNPPPHIRPDRT